MAQVRRVRFLIYYCLAIFVSAIFGIFGKARPSWADQVYRQYNAQIFDESFRVAQAGSTLNAKSTNVNTLNTTSSNRFLRHQSVTMDPNATNTSPSDRFLRHQTVFDVSDQPGLQLDATTGNLLERGLVLTPATLDFSNPQSANKDLSDAIDLINQKIESGAELSLIERAFIQSYTLNQGMLQELKLNVLKDQQK